MNRKQLALLLALGIVAGFASLAVLRANRNSWQSSAARPKVFAQFPLNEVRHLRIVQGGGELNLVRKDDIWRVRERFDYPANFAEISDFLRKLWELKAVQWMPVGPSQYERLELVSPGGQPVAGTGTLIELKDSGGKTLKSLILGKKHNRQMEAAGPFGGGGGYPDGRYLLAPGESKEVALVSEIFSNAEAAPDPWFDKSFFKVEGPREIAVAGKSPAQSWKLTRAAETAEWKLDGLRAGETLDRSKASGPASALAYPSFTSIASPQAKSEETGLNAPSTVTVKTFDGFTYQIKVGKAAADSSHHLQVSVAGDFPRERVAAKDEKPADKERLDKEFKEKLPKLEEKLKTEKGCEPWIYLVSKSTIDSLLKDRKDLLAEKKEAKKDAPKEKKRSAQ